MTRPLAIRYDSSVPPKFSALEEMNDVRIEYPVYQICAAIADELSSGGNLTINMNSGTGTEIGTFVDTYNPDIVGYHPATTTPTSVSYVFTQILEAGTTSPVRPVEYSTIQNPDESITTGIRQMSIDNIRTEFFDRVTAKLAAQGLGSYILRPEAPVNAGDTWTKVHTITDTLQTGSNETYIWRKTAESVPAEYRPLKIINTSGDLREMSDTDIKSLFDSYANYVIATGKGKYVLQEFAPVVTGQTYVKMGTSLSDNITKIEDKTYTGTYVGSYSSAVLTTFTGSYTGTYTASYVKVTATAFRRTYGSSNSNLYYSSNVTTTREVPINLTTEKSYTSGVTTAFGKTDLESFIGKTVTSTITKVSSTNLWLRTK